MATLDIHRARLMNTTKSITERVLQALGFEGLALLICTPLLVWITGRPALEMGAVTLAISLLALTWNMIFNSLFDRLKVRLQLAKVKMTHVPYTGDSATLNDLISGRVDIAVVSSEVNLIPLLCEEQEQLLDETGFAPRIDLPGDTSLS